MDWLVGSSRSGERQRFGVALPHHWNVGIHTIPTVD